MLVWGVHMGVVVVHPIKSTNKAIPRLHTSPNYTRCGDEKYDLKDICLSKVLSENIVIRKSLGLYQPIVFCKLDLTILTSLCYKHCSAICLNLKSKMKAINL